MERLFDQFSLEEQIVKGKKRKRKNKIKRDQNKDVNSRERIIGEKNPKAFIKKLRYKL